MICPTKWVLKRIFKKEKKNNHVVVPALWIMSPRLGSVPKKSPQLAAWSINLPTFRKVGLVLQCIAICNVSCRIWLHCGRWSSFYFRFEVLCWFLCDLWLGGGTSFIISLHGLYLYMVTILALRSILKLDNRSLCMRWKLFLFIYPMYFQ